MKIIFVTHGQTLDNAHEILVGQLYGGELSPQGRLQAQELGMRLKDTKIDAAYSSDLSRAVQTANEILKYHKSLKLILTKELRERSYGSYQGRKKSEMGWRYELVAEDYGDFEPIKDLYLRIEKFLVEIAKKHNGETVLLVGHRNAGVALEAVARGIPVSHLNTIPELKGGEVRIYEYDGGQ